MEDREVYLVKCNIIISNPEYGALISDILDSNLDIIILDLRSKGRLLNISSKAKFKQ